jgi:hypothetical protein
MKIQFHQYDVYFEQFELIERRFRLLFDNPEEFYRILEAGMRFTNVQHIDNKIALVRQNFFSLELLQALICGGASYKTGPVNYIWKHMKEAQIFLDSLGSTPSAFIDHSLVTAALRVHLDCDTFQNILRPPSSLAARYQNAIVAVDVLNRDGDPNRGTGFVIAWENQQFVLTCKHNVDHDLGITLQSMTTASSTALCIGAPQFFGDVDICAFPLEQHVDGPVFRLSDMVEMFDDVYTLGYPHVPGARSEVLGHRGEVNGNADMFLSGSSLMIISNLISPGSSGCPVLLSNGFCVGMSVRWLEGRYGADGDERARFSAALPGGLLISLLSQRE